MPKIVYTTDPKTGKKYGPYVYEGDGTTKRGPVRRTIRATAEITSNIAKTINNTRSILENAKLLNEFLGTVRQAKTQGKRRKNVKVLPSPDDIGRY